jgi:hypothetical protein
MDVGLARDLVCVLIGAFTGVLSALFGVGGAVVSTPALRLLGASATTAIGTPLIGVLPSAITGTIRYSRNNLIELRVVAVCGGCGAAMAVAGALVSHALPGDGHVVMLLTAFVLLYTAAAVARGPKKHVDVDGNAVAPPDMKIANAAYIGVGAGFMSGLLGVGGGFLMVPAFVRFLHMPMRRAIATSLGCVGLFAIPGIITHALVGNIDWRLGLALAVGVVPGAYLGSKIVIGAAENRLRVAMALFLVVVALVFGVGEIISIVND